MASKSFSKSQRAVLDSGFLDEIGSTKGGGMQFDKTAQAVVDEVTTLLLDIEKNLKEEQAVSTGNLTSTATQEISVQAGVLQIDVLLEDYYKFVDEGVNGVVNNRGAKFSFKSRNPSRKMVDEIEQWLKRAGASSTNVKKSVSKKESVGLSFANASRSKAFAVAASIKRKGIKPTKFLTDAVIALNQRLAGSKVIDAYRVDVIESIKKFDK